MPRLKQPPRLLTMATDVLINDLSVEYLHKCSIEGSMDKLGQHITFLKEDIGSYIPYQLAADFYGRLLQKFLDILQALVKHPNNYRKTVMELIMDRKFVGLKFKSSVLQPTEVEDAHRIHGLQELRFYSGYHNLGKFHLEDLRVLVYYGSCTDSDIKVIGRNCPKLEYLDINSAQITDDGLLALRSCSKLRDLFLHNQGKLTYKGIRDFLSATKTIQTFHVGSCGHGADSDGFANVGWSVYPVVKDLAIDMKHIENRNLICITEKFPNLNSVVISGELDSSADLSTLASLTKLSKLQVLPQGHLIFEDLKPLLEMIGANITSLQVDFCPRCSRSYLDFLYKFCPDMEVLDFGHRPRTDGEILVIPPFKRLRKLRIDVWSGDDPLFLELQFDVMPRLEIIALCECPVTTEMIALMILDNIKFPNLVLLRLEDTRCEYDIDYIDSIVKNRNLDFAINIYTTGVYN